MIFVTGDDDENRVYFTDLEKLGEITGKLPLTTLINGLKSSFGVSRSCVIVMVRFGLTCHDMISIFQYVTNTGSKFIFRTNRNATNYRLIQIDLDNPAEENWSTLLKV